MIVDKSAAECLLRRSSYNANTIQIKERLNGTGMIGLGRMGANMVRRERRHQCVVYDRSADAVRALVTEGAVGATSLAELIAKMQTPRAIWR
jgi:6-phosphogluconate dehydrogenase